MHASHPQHAHQDEINKVGAIVVLFEWNWQAIEPLITMLLEQVDIVCVVDNGQSVESLPVWPNGVHYLPMARNIGIAAAQNKGAALLFSHACDAVLLMDQDSQIPKSYLADLKNAWKILAKAGMPIGTIGAAYRDVKTGRISDGIRYSPFGTIQRIPISASKDPIRVDYVIASGSIVSMRAWQLLGGMDEALFAYLVDIEWGLRAKHQGFESYLLPKPMMAHSIGKKTTLFFGRQRVVHDNFRQYFILRNPLLMLRYAYLPLPMRLMSALMVFIKYAPGYIVVSQHPKLTLKNTLQAIRDGIANRCGGRY